MVLRVIHSVRYHSRRFKWNVDKRKVILVIQKSALEMTGYWCGLLVSQCLLTDQWLSRPSGYTEPRRRHVKTGWAHLNMQISRCRHVGYYVLHWVPESLLWDGLKTSIEGWQKTSIYEINNISYTKHLYKFIQYVIQIQRSLSGVHLVYTII